MRRVRLEYPDDLALEWNAAQPECAIAANAVSLLMPVIEPFVVRTASRAAEQLGPADADVVRAFCAQETSHQVQHRRLNDRLVAQAPGLVRVESFAARWTRWTAGRSPRFALATASGFETIAYSVARWAEAHARRLFDGADETAATLFMWHLAEEVEHKAVVFDLLEPNAVGRVRRLLGALNALLFLVVCTWLGTVAMLAAGGRLLSPRSWLRLVGLGTTLAFDVLTDLAASLMPRHHPDQMSDPILLTTWLRHVDPATGTVPVWSPTGRTTSR